MFKPNKNTSLCLLSKTEIRLIAGGSGPSDFFNINDSCFKELTCFYMVGETAASASPDVCPAAANPIVKGTAPTFDLKNRGIVVVSFVPDEKGTKVLFIKDFCRS
jgi:hypothetical protein